MSLGTFDLKKTRILLGSISIEGFAEGDSISISEEGDAFATQGGADGHTDRIRNHNNRLNIVVRLRQTAPVNDLLSALHLTDRGTGAGVVPFFLQDLNGNTLISAVNTWIIKYADYTAGDDAKVREWTIHSGSDYAVLIGGNQ